MGFWSGLGKLALKAAPYVAAPFTGGTSMAFAPMANNLASSIGPRPQALEGMMQGGSGRIPGMNGFMPGEHDAMDSWMRQNGGPLSDSGLISGLGGFLGRLFGKGGGGKQEVKPGTGPLNNEAYRRQSPGIGGRMGGMMRNLQNPHPHLAGPLMAGIMTGRQNPVRPMMPQQMPNTTMPIGPRTPLAGMM